MWRGVSCGCCCFAAGNNSSEVCGQRTTLFAVLNPPPLPPPSPPRGAWACVQIWQFLFTHISAVDSGRLVVNTGRGCSPPRPLLAVPNVTSHPSTASVPVTVFLYNGPLLCGCSVPIKGLSINFRDVHCDLKWRCSGDRELHAPVKWPTQTGWSPTFTASRCTAEWIFGFLLLQGTAYTIRYDTMWRRNVQLVFKDWLATK